MSQSDIYHKPSFLLRVISTLGGIASIIAIIFLFGIMAAFFPALLLLYAAIW